jgi:exopolyphosphatase/pppGpp-phosphohydrolase
MSHAETEIVVVDIGGGSTELVRGDYKGIKMKCKP